MSDLDSVLNRARDWNSRRGQLSGSLASLRKYDAEGVQILRKLISAVEADRTERLRLLMLLGSEIKR